MHTWCNQNTRKCLEVRTRCSQGAHKVRTMCVRVVPAPPPPGRARWASAPWPCAAHAKLAKTVLRGKKETQNSGPSHQPLPSGNITSNGC